MRLLQVMDALEPGSVLGPAFTAAAAYRLAGPISPPILQAALDDLVCRHAALRTEIVARPPHQRIAPVRPAMLTVTELGSASVAAFVADRPAGGPPEPPLPPLWAHLGIIDAQDAILLLGAHHATADAWSLELLMRDLHAAYRARTGDAVWPESDAPTYAELAAQARSPRAEARIRDALGYWRERLSGLPPVVNGQWSAARSATRGRYSWITDIDALTTASRSARTTPFVVLMAALAVALHRRYGVDDLVIPVLTAGRGPREWSTVGWFLNLVPIRIHPQRGCSVGEIVGQVHRDFAAACRHEVPATRVIEAVPALGRLLTAASPTTPVFQAIQLPPVVAPAAGMGFTYRRVETPPEVPTSGPGPWDQVWTIRVADRARGWVTHDTGLLPVDTVEALVTTVGGMIQREL